MISASEISKHNKATDLWLVVDNNVWNITDFAPTHPGGLGSMSNPLPSAVKHRFTNRGSCLLVILRYAGKDATDAYSEIHAPSIISGQLGPEMHMGILDRDSVDEASMKPAVGITRATISGDKPPLHTLISTLDFEEAAQKTSTKKTWAFHSSAATDLITKGANSDYYDKIMLRPRMLVDVETVSTETTILGVKTGVPFFVAPAAMAKLAHPEGEKAIARGCRKSNMIHTISTQASYPVDEIVRAEGVAPNQPFFFQLYVNKDRPKSEELLARVKALGIKAIFVTIDSPIPGKREADERAKGEEGLTIPSGGKAESDKKGGAYGRIMGRFVDASLSWKDIRWLRRNWDGPIVLKGVMTAMDARLAVEHGCDGIVLSNHGGRNLDTSPPSILMLLEMQKCCPEVFDKLEVLVDGGIRRGTDIFKALCLGARGVGIGRGFLYALIYGQEGIEAYSDSQYSSKILCTNCKGY